VEGNPWKSRRAEIGAKVVSRAAKSRDRQGATNTNHMSDWKVTTLLVCSMLTSIIRPGELKGQRKIIQTLAM